MVELMENSTSEQKSAKKSKLYNIEGSGFSGKQIFYISLVCFLAWTFAVYDYVLFGTVLPKIADSLGWSTTYSTFIATIVSVGVFVIALSIGPLLDYIGRKATLCLAVGGMALVSGLTALSPNAIYLIIVRAFSGLGYSEEEINTVYLNEIYGSTSNKRRGFTYSFVQSGWPVGALIAAGMSALFIPIVGWRGTFVVAAIPGIFIALMALWLPQSPIFKVLKKERKLRKEGKHDEADKVSHSVGLNVDQSGQSSFRQLFNPALRRHTILLCSAWFLNWMAIQVFAVLGTTVLTQAKGVSFSNALIVLVLANFAGACGYFTHGFVGDYLGRRRTILFGWLIGSAVTTVMLFGPNTSEFVIALYAIGLFFLTGPYSAMLFYMGESFPARVRGIGSNSAHVMGPIGAIAGSGLLTLITDLGVNMMWAAFISGSVMMFLSALCMMGTRDVSDASEAETLESQNISNSVEAEY